MQAPAGSSATFDLGVPARGNYDVAMWWPAAVPARSGWATAMSVTLNTGAVTTAAVSVTVDLTKQGGDVITPLYNSQCLVTHRLFRSMRRVRLCRCGTRLPSLWSSCQAALRSQSAARRAAAVALLMQSCLRARRATTTDLQSVGVEWRWHLWMPSFSHGRTRRPTAAAALLAMACRGELRVRSE